MPGRGVLVLGMHRSGTSVITHLLHLGGLAIGRDGRLDRGGPANPRGFWEIQSLTRLNESLLRTLGGGWSAPPDLVPGWESDPRLRRLRPRAVRAFRRSMPDAAWLWKDPRLCLTTPFWRSIGVQIGAVVLAVRNPLDVAGSLRARNGFDARLGLALWERYTREALAQARQLPTVLVDLDTVAEDPVGWTTDAIRWLGVSGMPIIEDPDRDRIASVYEADLRHSRRTEEELRLHPEASPGLAELYARVRRSQGFFARGVGLPLPPPTPWMSAEITERRRERTGPRHRSASPVRRARRAAVRGLVGVRDRVTGSVHPR